MSKKFTIPFPLRNDVPDFYRTYTDYLEPGDLVLTLEKEKKDTIALFGSLNPKQQLHQYEEGKWTPKEVLLHIIDTERIFAYRLLRIAREDKTPLPGFDQNVYVPVSGANSRSMESLIEEYSSVRNATLSLVRNLPGDAWEHTGTASQVTIHPKTIAFTIAGHELHHKRILKERYL